MIIRILFMTYNSTKTLSRHRDFDIDYIDLHIEL